MARAAEPHEQHAIALVEVHDLDVAAVRRDVGTQRVERFLDPIDGIHGPWRNSY